MKIIDYPSDYILRPFGLSTSTATTARFMLACAAPKDIPEWFQPKDQPLVPGNVSNYREARVAQWPWYYADLVLKAEPPLPTVETPPASSGPQS